MRPSWNDCLADDTCSFVETSLIPYEKEKVAKAYRVSPLEPLLICKKTEDEPHNKLPLPLQQKSTTPPNSYTPATNPAQAG